MKLYSMVNLLYNLVCAIVEINIFLVIAIDAPVSL